MSQEMEEAAKHIYRQPDPTLYLKKVAFILLLSGIVGSLFVAFFYNSLRGKYQVETTSKEKVTRFSSAKDFKEYLLKGGSDETYFSATPMRGDVALKNEGLAQPSAATADRFSQTNVQVVGIDEPDILKTDGENIFFSQESPRILPLIESRGVADFAPMQSETKIIKAFPPDEMKDLNKIAYSGDLLLNNKVLIIFSGESILGYDVSRPESPEQKWENNLEDNYLVTARLYKDKLYLVLGNYINQESPCPVPVLKNKGLDVSLSCGEIYHPERPMSSNVLYSVLKIDPENGEVLEKISFLGNSGNGVAYMSYDWLYLTYSYHEDYAQIYYNFFLEGGANLLPVSVLEKLQKLVSYDISVGAKYVEVQNILSEYELSLGKNERLKFENEMNNKLMDFIQNHAREIERTGIVKVDLLNLKIATTGSVPGHPLNQFSLDEYKNKLRVAVSFGGFLGTTEQTNDLYILDQELDLEGEVTSFGKGERIYSVRFLGDKAYIVTFKETDPFFIVDLSDTKSPKITGELKIPGFSSYLHPIGSKILGIGKEGQYVKLSLFDVSDPYNPSEVSKYTLSEYWSEALDTHHAFMLDEKHKVFFIPGQRGGYAFSYADDKLEIRRVVSEEVAKRALYIDDYLYIVGENKIVVFDENDWEIAIDKTI